MRKDGTADDALTPCVLRGYALVADRHPDLAQPLGERLEDLVPGSAPAAAAREPAAAFVHAAVLECAVTLSRDVRLGFGG